MEEQKNNQNQNPNRQNLSDTDLFKFLNKYKVVISIIAFLVFFASDMYYTIDANERGVVLRFGKATKNEAGAYALVEPGLHFKLPIIDKVEKVKVDFIYKEEFGYKTVDADVKSEYAKGQSFEEVSWMLTNDPSIAEVTWVVQYKIQNPGDYLFEVRNVKNTIRDVSEASIRLAVGDQTFDEVIGDKRDAIAEYALNKMRDVLSSYKSGIQVQTVKLMSVKPPQPVADSFNKVNQAEQQKEVSQNVARKDSTNKINVAIGFKDRLINEALGYEIDKVNRAKGVADRFLAMLDEYSKDKSDVTKVRLYYDKISSVLANSGEVVIFDEEINNLSPLFNFDKLTSKSND